MGPCLLQVRSEHSLLEGVGSVAAWAEAAKREGYAALGLCDVNRMSGLILFYEACRRLGIRPLLGAEIREAGPTAASVSPRSEHQGAAGAFAIPDGSAPAVSALLFARDAEGYGDLCEIITRRHDEGVAFSLTRVLSKPWPHLIVLSRDAVLLDRLAQGPNRDRLYGALVRHSPRARAHSRRLEAFCDARGIPLAACADAGHVAPEDHDTHRLLRAIDGNTSLSRLREDESDPSGSHLPSRARLADLFSDRPDALRHADALGAACRAELPLGRWIMPKMEMPAGHTPESRLAELADEGLRRNYGGTPAFERAETVQAMELAVIGKLGYASYFLMVREVFAALCGELSEGYRTPLDCSLLRGSAANSLTFYNLGVGRLDPLRHDLYFQRFLNEDRASPPDADIDFGWDERDRALDFVRERFGEDRVAVTCTFQRFKGRAAFRETAKVFGYSDEQVSEWLRASEVRADHAYDAEVLRILEWSRRINGAPRFLGQHPGGLIITPDRIDRRVACEWSGGAKNRRITQIDMHSGIDGLGLIKFDLLGNGSLSVLRDALRSIHEQGLPDPRVWDLERCQTDARVQAIMKKGLTRGVFYIESPAQTRLNRKAEAETFEEITITSSLVRPAGTAYAQTFVERHRNLKRGIKDWEFLHPSLEPILRETHDVCAFQEDVTKICHYVAGLSFKQADAVRKQMNSQHEGALAGPALRELARTFMEGCRRHSGLDEAQAAELWRRVASFTGFSFCKSHSASYAQLSFQCAWLKAHYPAEFLAAVIGNDHGYYRREVYLNEARRWGVRILPLCVNHSRERFFGAAGCIRPGFQHLHGLSQATLRALLDVRVEGGLFSGLEDFLRRVRPGRAETEALIRVGAFDAFGYTQPELHFHLDGIYARVAKEAARAEAALGIDLFAGAAGAAGSGDSHSRDAGEDADPARDERPVYRGLPDLPLLEKCLNEKQALGYMLSANPLHMLAALPGARGAVPAAELERHAGKRVKVFGLHVADRLHPVASDGRVMEFLTLEDQTGTVDIVFWPDELERWRESLTGIGLFEIWGKVSEEAGTYSLEADAVRPANFQPNQVDFVAVSASLERGAAAGADAGAAGAKAEHLPDLPWMDAA